MPQTGVPQAGVPQAGVPQAGVPLGVSRLPPVLLPIVTAGIGQVFTMQWCNLIKT